MESISWSISRLLIPFLKRVQESTVSTAEFIPDPRLRMLPFSDVDVFNYAHVVCLEERKGERLIGAFLGGVTELLKRRGGGRRSDRTKKSE